MAFSIFALNNEFAVSTGSNVNSSPGQSKFDYPPQSSKDLVITTKDGDPDPRLFEIGDVYDISYGGTGGGATMTDAVVIRSDEAPDAGGGGGVIVFEGLDEYGELTHVVWTPDFDVEQWYWDNHSGGNPPEFHTTDMNAAYDHSFVCFDGATRIDTPGGGVPAAGLQAGDRVMTLDSGAKRLIWVGRRQVRGLGTDAPVVFAPGVIGNRAELRLSQQHRVLVRSAMAELFFGTPEVLVPARSLVDGVAVRIAPVARITYVHLLLRRHAILRAEGAHCESLLLGDVAAARIDAAAHAEIRAQARVNGGLPALQHARAARPVLTMREARMVKGGLRPVPAADLGKFVLL